MFKDQQADRSRAEARFLKAQKQQVEGREAMTEYQARAHANDLNIARLRELRLAKEEKERLASADSPPAVKSKVRGGAGRAAKAKT